MEAEKILREIEEISKNEFLPIIGPLKGQVLVEAITERKPRKILEIGTLVGYSALLMALHMPKNAKITAIEKSEGLVKIAKRNIKKAGLSKRIEVVQGDARKVIPSLSGKFDFVFIDAEKSEYLDYLRLAEPKMSKSCVVVADNVKIFKNTMDDYLNHVRNPKNYKSKTYDVGFDAVEVSVKK